MAVGGFVAQRGSRCGRALWPRRAATSRDARYGTGAAVFADRLVDGRPSAASGKKPTRAAAARLRSPRT